MTIKKLFELLKDIAQSKPNVNYVGIGNVYDLNSKPDVEYGVVYLTYGSTSVYDYQINHTVTLFYIDRLTDNFDNRLEIQTNGVRELTNIINTLVNQEDIEISYPLTFTPFNQRFIDDCAGVFTTITFITDGENTCNYE